jgi:hypothetical protein
VKDKKGKAENKIGLKELEVAERENFERGRSRMRGIIPTMRPAVEEGIPVIPYVECTAKTENVEGELFLFREDEEEA